MAIPPRIITPRIAKNAKASSAVCVCLYLSLFINVERGGRSDEPPPCTKNPNGLLSVPLLFVAVLPVPLVFVAVLFVKKLNEVDTEGIEPLMHISNQFDVFRKDEIAGDFSVNEALINANNKNEQFFLVPKVINK